MSKNFYQMIKDGLVVDGGGGAPAPVLIEKSITANGDYSASTESADGYSAVSVAVPNTYSAGDEGKVVSNGALVTQTSDTATQNGTVDTTLISSLTVNVPSGGGGAEKKAVNFIDYDGTIVHSYTAAEFAELTEFPANPSHDGLTAQGWNWSLADARTYVASYGKLNIGQMYTTTDGKTHIHIVLEDGRLEPVLGLGVNGSVDIDWGDGTEHTTLTGTAASTYVSTSPHTYALSGEYTIKLTVTGTARFLSKNSVCGLLRKSGFDENQSKCYINAIKSIDIGSSVTGIGNYAFYNCNSLSGVTIPDSVTSIGNSAFYNCYSLSSVTIPDSVTGIGSDAFRVCNSLSGVTIPDGVESIGNYAFYSCYSLSSVTIPDSVTGIGNNAFMYCYSLSSVTIPDSVTSIGNNAFSDCYGLGKITFTRETPPTVQSSNAFSGIPTDCAVLVKSYAYLSASYYPSPSTYTYAYYDTIADGTALPATIPDESTTSLTWYATIADLRAETNPITVGNGKEVYAKMTSTS